MLREYKNKAVHYIVVFVKSANLHDLLNRDHLEQELPLPTHLIPTIRIFIRLLGVWLMSLSFQSSVLAEG